ncbi:MAG: PbsX family transcriptional regulator [Gemmatimonadaceae bacterium]|nr:PbsX family transcriptional regulator [Acetobacteraceae bacterium]
MKIVVRKLGDSASVRSAAAGMEAARLQLDQPVDVREEDGRIIVEPIRADTYDLAPLVAGISDENRHEAVEMGPRVGREAW